MPRAIILWEDGVVPAAPWADFPDLDVEWAPDVELLPTPLPRLLLGLRSTAPHALNPPFSGYVEASAALAPSILETCVAAIEASGVCYAARTATAMAEDPSPALMRALLRRMPALEHWQPAMELALVEATANALIHGNLEVGSNLRISAEGLSAFNRQLNDSLADPRLAGRYVVVTAIPLGSHGVTVAVSDQGNGYDVGQVLARRRSASTKSGRGLDLIQKVARRVHGEDGGRTIRMDFY